MFEEFIINARNDRYNIICSIDAHEKDKLSYFYYVRSGGGNLLPSNSTTESLVSLIATINLIGCRLQDLEHNFLERCNMYFFAMRNMFQKIPVELPKPPVTKENTNNYYMLLEVVGI